MCCVVNVGCGDAGRGARREPRAGGDYSAGPPLQHAVIWELGDPRSGSPEFGSIQSVAVHSDGSIFVLDALNSEVIAVSADGKLIRRFGSKGDGPGELRAPKSIAVARDTVFVLDRTLKLFATSGSPIGTIETHILNLSTFRSVKATDRGLFLSRRVPDVPTKDGVSADTIQIVWLDVRSGKSDVVAKVPLLTRRVEAGAFVPVRRGYRAQFDIDADGRVFTAEDDGLTITTSSGGRRSVFLRYSGERIATTAEDDDDYVSSLRIYSGLTARGIRQVRQFQLEPLRPVFGNVYVAPDRRLLIERVDLTPRPYALFDSTATIVWETADAAGAPEGHITLPIGFKPIFFDGCRIVGTARTTYDVPVLQVISLVNNLCDMPDPTRAEHRR